MRLIVDFGYELHSIKISDVDFNKIQGGHPLVVEGQGFPVEGVMEQDHWAFNHGAEGAIRVSTDTGREVFEGGLWDDEVVVHRN